MKPTKSKQTGHLRIALLIGSIAVLVGCVQRTGYVDPTKALNDTADGKANIASLNAFAEIKRSEIAGMRTDARKEKDEDVAKAKLAKADQAEREAQAELQRRQNEGAKRISAGLERILPKLREAHHFAALAQTPLAADPDLELTAELVRLYNAGEGEPPPPPETPAATQKKLADLEQKVAAYEAARPIPAGSPPVASNTQKQKGGAQ